LSQFKGKKLHQGLEKLHLHAWLLSVRLSDREAFLEKQPSVSLEQLDSQQGQYMTQNGQSFDPLSITTQQLAEFLLYLFEDKGYTPSTIKGYRSAIARTIHLSGGPEFGSDEFLSLMFKNVGIERPKQRRLVPAWDLGIVLKALQLSPFEPLDLISFRFLTYKCCFLLALATGRRRSELHALSVSESCIRFAANNPQLPF
jgi:integrase